MQGRLAKRGEDWEPEARHASVYRETAVQRGGVAPPLFSTHQVDLVCWNPPLGSWTFWVHGLRVRVVAAIRRGFQHTKSTWCVESRGVWTPPLLNTPSRLGVFKRGARGCAGRRPVDSQEVSTHQVDLVCSKWVQKGARVDGRSIHRGVSTHQVDLVCSKWVQKGARVDGRSIHRGASTHQVDLVCSKWVQKFSHYKNRGFRWFFGAQLSVCLFSVLFQFSKNSLFQKRGAIFSFQFSVF